MLHAFLTFAAEAIEEEESSKALFYIAGGLLAGWAVIVSLIGIKRHENWPSEGAAKGVMGLTALLVVFAASAAVITG